MLFSNFLSPLARGVAVFIYDGHLTPSLLLEAAKVLRPAVIDTIPSLLSEQLRGEIRCGWAFAPSGVKSYYALTESPGGLPRDPEFEQHQLILRPGTTFAGYLRHGTLTSTVCKTGDIFHNGKFLHRLDDLIHLSTGEIVNPVPLEKEFSSRVAIIGQKQPSLFLIVDGNDDVDDAVRRVNASQRRIKRSHILRGQLPIGMHGVLRARTELLYAEAMKQVLADDLAHGLDWGFIEREAYERNFDSVAAYLSDRGLEDAAIFGIDSLGVRALQNQAMLEIRRITDNVKAWTILLLVMIRVEILRVHFLNDFFRIF